jgi:hypothetical protein
MKNSTLLRVEEEIRKLREAVVETGGSSLLDLIERKMMP